MFSLNVNLFDNFYVNNNITLGVAVMIFCV